MQRVARRLLLEIIKDYEQRGELARLDKVALEVIRRGVHPREVFQAIEELEREGELVLVRICPASLAEYLLSPQALSLWFVVAVSLVASALALLDVTEHPWVFLRYVFGTVFLLFIPGFSLIRCLYYRREDLTDLERLALSIGLSLAVVPLIGLALNYTPFGIRRVPVTISIASFSIVMIVLAHLRSYRYLRELGERETS